MESLEVRGKTVEEAIQNALTQLGVSREEVEIAVIKEGKLGILGLGAEEAIVSVKPLRPVAKKATGEVATEVLKKLLALMEVSGSVTAETQPVLPGEEAGASIVLNVEGDDLGILIGRRGQTLTCLQHIVRLILGQQTKAWVPIVIDVEGYKRRYQALQAFALRMAEQVSAQGTPFTLEPMPPYERRIIHITLAGHPNVVTESIGEGESRKVVILPKER